MTNAKAITGLLYPVVQAPMAGVQGSRLAIAVSAAGGLGSLPCAMLSATQIESEIKAIRSAGIECYNVNFFCHKPLRYSTAQAERWLSALANHLQQLNVSPDAITAGSGRSPFSHELADVIEPFKPPVISFHFGLPDADILERLKTWDVCIISTATTVREAQWLESQGVSAVIAQGLEAGGHRGMFLSDDLTTQSGTFALLPQVVSAVDVPVIAAGGVSTTQGVSAALSMGATAVQAGTAFLLCDEADTSELHRAQLQSDAALHTAITNVFSGKPARSIVNKAVREIGPICDAVMDFPHTANAMAVLRSKAEACGSADYTPLWCGQNASGCRSVPALDLVKELVGAV